MERKQKEKKEKEEKSLKNATEVWRFINKRRKIKVWREADISKEEWRDYFKDLEIKINGVNQVHFLACKAEVK